MGRNRIGGVAGSLVVALGTVVLLCGTVAHGQPTAKTTKASAGGWPKGEKITYPAEGQVSAERVRVRAGPGLNYYVCGTLSQGSKVVVHQERSGWLKIDPPKGAFSLIAAKYVEKSASDQGVVTGSVVRVRAGASESKQNYQVQCKLNKGDKVRILGQVTSEVAGEKLSFYKIKPPRGKAFLWVSAQYVGYVKSYKGEPAVRPEDIVEIPTFPDIENVLKIPESPKVAKSADRTELKNLDEALRIEMRRPVAQRQLAEHLAKYMGLSAKTKSESIAELTQSRIKEIRRHMDIQAALKRSANIKESYEESQRRMQQLVKTYATAGSTAEEKLREATGRLTASYVFRSRGMERWRLVDPFTGKNICYLLPGVVSGESLKSKEGKIVTISGPAVFDLRVRLDLVVVNKILSDDS